MSINSIERIHEIGAHRHGSRWIYANQRAVDAASEEGMNYTGAREKKAIALIVLKVLDGQMLDTGFVWSKEGDKWIPRIAVEVAKKLRGEKQEA